MKFGFITDTHFDYKYESRKDNTLETLLDKTRQCYEKFKESGCDFVLHGGDMFDRHRIYNFDLIRGVRKIFKETGLVTYFILGQHDAQGYNRNTLVKSNLGFVSDISDDSLVFVKDRLELSDCILYACHVDEDAVHKINAIKHEDKPVICMVHSLLTDQKEAFGTISITHIKNPNVNLVLSGDLHDGVPFQTVNNIQFYNPGALARTEKGTRMPKAGILSWNGKTFDCEEFYPKCPANEDIFFEEKVKTASVNKEVSAISFVESLKNFDSVHGNAFDLLEKVGKEQHVSADVMEMIKLYKDRKDK